MSLFPDESDNLYYQQHFFLLQNAKVYLCGYMDLVLKKNSSLGSLAMQTVFLEPQTLSHACNQITLCLFKMLWIHIHTRRLNLYYLCVFQKSLWSTPQLWWAAQRSQQVSRLSLHLSPEHCYRMRRTKTYISIFLFYTQVLKCGININTGQVCLFEVTHRQQVHWGWQNAFIVLKMCPFGTVSPATALTLVESCCTANK